MVLATWGCGVVHRMNGTFEGVRPFQVEPGKDEFVVRQAATVTLTVKPDGTADLADGGLPAEGHIEYGTNEARFVPDAIAGIGVVKQSQKLVDQFTVTLRRQDDDHWIYRDGLVLRRR